MLRARNKSTTKAKQTIRSSSLSYDNEAEGSTAIYPCVDSKYQNVNLIREFKALVPSIFQGGPNFLEAKNWLKEVKKILDVMVVPEIRRVSLASFMLKDEVDGWQDTIKTTHDVLQMTWIQFKELLLSNYFPKAIKRQKRIEFIHLVQRNMTVTKYASKFTQISRYAPNVVVDEQM